MTKHPITPPPELVQQWFLSAKAMPVDQWVTDVATKAARWGANMELEACCEWLDTEKILTKDGGYIRKLRAARRPNPPRLKEQALHELTDVYNRDKIDDSTYDTIRRALEALLDD
jgi:hypothetical protein